MEDYLKYSEWIKYIEQGREFDFYYLGNKYSISGNGYGWFLTQYGDHENAQEFNNALALFENATINNIPIKDICETFEILMIY